MLVRFSTESEFRVQKSNGQVCGQMKFTRTFRTRTDTDPVQADDVASDVEIPWLQRSRKTMRQFVLGQEDISKYDLGFQEQHPTE